VVEDITARLVASSDVAVLEACESVWQAGEVPVLIDPKATSLPYLKPTIVIDAIIAKKNLGTNRAMAPITMALGPGFEAGIDVDAVIETMRGHRLGQVYFAGSAIPNTGIPGEVGGKSAERVIHAPHAGKVIHAKAIGDVVVAGEVLFYLIPVEENDFTQTSDLKDVIASFQGGSDQAIPPQWVPVLAPISGTLRGLITEGLSVPQGLKVADVDPRVGIETDCMTISDKARALGGAALEAVLYFLRRR